MYSPQFANPYSNPYANPYAMGQIAANRLSQMPQTMPNPYAQINQPQSELQFVNGRESADMYQMPPNSKAILMDSTMARFYLKETDASGMARVTAYDFTPASDAPTEQYVTREEFDAWRAKYEPTASKPAARRTRKPEPERLSQDDDA